MTREEAQEILALLPPGAAATTQDPQVQQALALVQKDPELAAWWAQEQAMDQALATALRELPVDELRRERVTSAPSVPEETSWRGLGLWAAAAALFLGLVGALAWPSWHVAREREHLTAWVAKDLSDPGHGVTGGRVSHWQQTLGSATDLTQLSVASDWEALTRDGCRTFQLGSRVGLEICFSRAEGEFHLYLTPLRVGGDRPAQEHLVDGRRVISWVREGVLYALHTGDPTPTAEGFLRSLVSSGR